MPILDAGFDPLYPVVRFTSPDPVTSSTSNPPTSFSLSTPFSNTSTVISAPSRLDRHDGLVRCPDCGQEFTGIYRSGNLSRHRKQKHLDISEGLYNCTFPGCPSVFRRSDARLKHARLKHPGLHLPPAQRRHGTEYSPLPWTANEDDPSMKALQSDTNLSDGLPDQLYQGHGTVKLEDLSAPALHVVAALADRLDPAEYARAFDSFFTQWESIIEQLLNDRSDAYPVYAQVLDEIRLVVHTVDRTGHGSHAPPGGHDSRSLSSGRARSRGNGNGSLGRSQSDRVTKQSSTSGGVGKNILVAVDQQADHEEREEVDCPVFKYHIMHNLRPPCRGCRVTVMSQVRSHLNPNRASGTHRGFPQFVEQCSRCKQDFVDRQVFDAHNTANNCAFQRQIRGEILLPWARQYLALYPNARRVPLPWPDSRGWIQESLLTSIRASRSSDDRPAAFLEEPRNLRHSQRSISHNPPSNAQHTDVMGHVLHNLVNPTYRQSASSFAAVFNETHNHMADLQPPIIGGLDNNSQSWQSVLQSLELHQRTFRMAAAHLTPEQLQYMVAQAERVFNISQGLYQQQQQLHAMQAEIRPAVRNDEDLARSNNPTFQSPAPSAYWRTPNHVHTAGTPARGVGPATPSTDRTRSDRSYAARSSQRLNSTLTNPSSTYSPPNSNLLSPYSPSDNRRTSLPSNVRPEAPRLSRAFPSRRSLPDNPENCIDPSLLDSPHEDNGQDFLDFQCYSPGTGN